MGSTPKLFWSGHWAPPGIGVLVNKRKTYIYIKESKALPARYAFYIHIYIYICMYVGDGTAMHCSCEAACIASETCNHVC